MLYGWEASGTSSLSEFAVNALAHRRVSPRYRDYLDRLIGGLEEHLPEIDRLLRGHTTNWKLERLAAIDRNILRIGTLELLAFEDVPPRVAIHESIRLAERYGGEKSPGFVNGVLDAVRCELPATG